MIKEFTHSADHGLALSEGLTGVAGRQSGDPSRLKMYYGLGRAEHRYAPVNPPEWIANLRPQVALLSVAEGDREGLPSPETLAARLSFFQTLANIPMA